MAPKPIRACGNVRQEPKVETGERDSLAVRMAAEGITSTPEYIEMIDRQVASGALRDNLADAIRLAVADKVAGKAKYDFPQLAAAMAGALAELTSDAGYRSSFDFNKASIDSMIDAANLIRTKYAGLQRPELTPDEDRQLRTVMAQLAADTSGDRDVAVLREVDRALGIVREKVLARLGVDMRSVGVSPLEAMGIQRMDVEGDDEQDDPSAFHMDMDSLGAVLEDQQPPEPQDLVPDEPRG